MEAYTASETNAWVGCLTLTAEEFKKKILKNFRETLWNIIRFHYFCGVIKIKGYETVQYSIQWW